MKRDPVESWALAQSAAHNPETLCAMRANGLAYADLRTTIDGRSVDGDEAHDLMRLRLMTGRHDEAEAIGRAITDALVAEIDRRSASTPAEPEPLHSFDHSIERGGEDIEIVVHVLSWEPGCPAQTWGPPERCYPEEPAEIDWTACLRGGGEADSLLTPDEAQAIEAEALMRMAELDESERDAYYEREID